MSSITLPINVLAVSKFSSIQDLKARESARQEAGPALEAMESFKQSRDAWMEQIQSLDGTAKDSAANEQGRVVLDEVRYPGGIHPSPYVTAESQAPADGLVRKAKISTEEYSDTDVNKSKFSYTRTAQREVYTETSSLGGHVKLVIDHTKGIVTFEAPNFENFADREFDTCLSRPQQ